MRAIGIKRVDLVDMLWLQIWVAVSTPRSRHIIKLRVDNGPLSETAAPPGLTEPDGVSREKVTKK